MDNDFSVLMSAVFKLFRKKNKGGWTPPHIVIGLEPNLFRLLVQSIKLNKYASPHPTVNDRKKSISLRKRKKTFLKEILISRNLQID